MANQFVIEDGVLLRYRGKKDHEHVVIPEGIYEISMGAFEDCYNVESVTIPGDVDTIGPDAFRRCKKLQKVTIMKGVTHIGEHAFCGCTQLLQVELPKTVQTLGAGGFQDCPNLVNVKLSPNISRIENFAFSGCSCLSEILLPTELRTINDRAFNNCKRLKAIWISKGVKKIGESAFSGCASLERIEVEEGNRRYHSNGNCLIDTGAKTLLRGCKNSIIPSDGSVNEIGHYAFDHCDSLSEIIIGDGVSTIGWHAFYQCSALETVELPNGLIKIDDAAFSGCAKLRNITLPETLKELGLRVFQECASLRELTIPQSVEDIGYSAFSKCSNILLFDLKEETIFYNDVREILFECPPDAVAFPLYHDPVNKRRSVMNWLEGNHRRDDDIEEIKAYVLNQKTKLLAEIAAHGSPKVLSAFIEFIGNVKFNEAAFDSAIIAAAENENAEIIKKTIREYKKKLLSSGLIKLGAGTIQKKARPKAVEKKKTVAKTIPAPQKEAAPLPVNYERVIFGKYIQDEETPSDLSWRVLAKHEGKMLLITEKVIDYLPFCYRDDNDWETSDIRRWLREDFVNTAFSEREKARIAEMCPGESVFLLSVSDLQLFANSKDLRAKYTDYARAKIKWFHPKGDENAFWWLRTASASDSPRDEWIYVYHIIDLGLINGGMRASGRDGVRPAVWVTMEEENK